MAIRIEILDATSGKSEEIAVLEKLVRSYKGSGTYLEGLFNNELLGWFRNQVQDDFTCDIMDTLEGSHADLARNNTDKMSLRNEIDSYKKRIEDLEYIHGCETRKYQKEIEALESRVEHKQSYLERVIADNTEMRNRMNSDVLTYI
jgi:hypothetical protein